MDPEHVLVVRFDEILFNRKPDAESDIKFLSLSLSLSMYGPFEFLRNRRNNFV